MRLYDLRMTDPKRDPILWWPTMADMVLIDILRPHGIVRPHLVVVVMEGVVAYRDLVEACFRSQGIVTAPRIPI